MDLFANLINTWLNVSQTVSLDKFCTILYDFYSDLMQFPWAINTIYCDGVEVMCLEGYSVVKSIDLLPTTTNLLISTSITYFNLPVTDHGYYLSVKRSSKLALHKPPNFFLLVVLLSVCFECLPRPKKSLRLNIHLGIKRIPKPNRWNEVTQSLTQCLIDIDRDSFSLSTRG